MIKWVLLGLLALSGGCGDSGGQGANAEAGDGSLPDGHAGEEEDASQADASDAGDDAPDGGDTDSATAMDASGADAGGSDMDGAGAVLELTLQAYCQGVAEWYYPYLQGCYGVEPYPDARAAERIADWAQRCGYAGSGVTGGRLVFDGMQATRCLSALGEVACFVPLEGLPACRGVFTGTVPAGDGCYPDETRFFAIFADSCQNGLCLGDGCPQVCEAYPALGEACLQSRCAPEHYCDATDHCRARKTEGEVCEREQCVAGLLCAQTSTDKRCLSPLAEGEACGPDTACAGPGLCDDGVCRAHVASGGPCLATLNCPDTEHCEIVAGASEGTCKPPGTTGASCTGDGVCATGYFCDSSGGSPGTCQPQIAVGLSCAGGGRCVEGAYCRYAVDTPDGVCAGQAGEGGDCLSYDVPEQTACMSGLFCMEDGKCHTQGSVSDPCAAFVADSCASGLFCSRETGTCAAPAAQGAQCNPFWANTCQAGLGCQCGLTDYAACGSTQRESTPTDTCQPLVEDGQPCKRATECTSGACQTADDVTYLCVDPNGPGPCLGS